ncbi:HIGH nucleotidyl transferase [Caproiciproducens sp. NJN-50]|uniref:tRNA(Met) cytidine acetate ligase n=1 Tax=Acutalibacteraceae TaxID=3082771 RepID=UPI000FFE1DDD|nr:MULTISPECIES: nucleotidyltransferase family protein [Acutalibacteraceae]QAT49799.1 HIGH nucleotidyl transferase [Caproiciproducens sp. NJN-50]
MLSAGIICEYNPFHLGHSYLIRRLREYGATHIVAVMSGNFVQRGDAAILSKPARALQALLCGADLVVELPLPWAVSGAERFALGGVSLLDAIGVDLIGFGSECGSVERLKEASLALSSPSLREAMRQSLAKGSTFAAARQRAVEQLYGMKTAELLRDPNNILGIEYLKAVGRIGSGIAPVTVQRYGSAHGGESGSGPYASSGQIRNMLQNGRDCSALMPPAAFSVLQEEIRLERAPASLFRAERAILAQLRRMTRHDFALLPDISEGLENRILNAVRQAAGLEDLYFLAKTKRYPLARIRRIVLSAFLGLKAGSASGFPPYIRVLGIGERGPEILQKAKAAAKLPIVSRPADLNALGDRAREIADLENRAADLYALCLPKVAPCGLDRTEKIITLPYRKGGPGSWN